LGKKIWKIVRQLGQQVGRKKKGQNTTSPGAIHPDVCVKLARSSK
jgi:hypothetical protein